MADAPSIDKTVTPYELLTDAVSEAINVARPQDTEAMDAIIPAAAWRKIVDAHASTLYARAHLTPVYQLSSDEERVTLTAIVSRGIYQVVGRTPRGDKADKLICLYCGSGIAPSCPNFQCPGKLPKDQMRVIGFDLARPGSDMSALTVRLGNGELMTFYAKPPTDQDKKLEIIANIIQGWLDWQEERDGKNLPDDHHVMSVPHWPSRGQLKHWIEALSQHSHDKRNADRYGWLRKQMKWQNCWADENGSRIKWTIWVSMPEPYVKGELLTDETVPAKLDAGIDAALSKEGADG